MTDVTFSEQAAIDFGRACNEIYRQAGKENDPGQAAYFGACYQYDVCAGMSIPTASAKQLARCRQANPPLAHPNPPVTSPARRLHRDGLILRDDTGAQSFELGVSAFPLLQLWRTNRPKALAFLEWMQASRLTMARAFGMLDGSLPWMQGALIPDGTWGDDLVSLAQEMAPRGQRLKLSLFACCRADQSAALHVIDQPQFFGRTADVLAPFAHVILDGGNEAEFNGWDPAPLPRPTWPLASRGSFGTDVRPPGDPFDTFDLHARRDPNWPVMLKDVFDIQHGFENWGAPLPVAGGIDEMIRLDETNPTNDNHVATTSPADCFDALAVPFGSYVVLHASAGMSCDVPGPVAQACVDAAVEAARLLPASARNGVYTRTGLSDAPLVDQFPKWLRCYGSIQGNECWMIAIRPQDDVQYVGDHGWTIQERLGPRGNLVRLTR